MNQANAEMPLTFTNFNTRYQGDQALLQFNCSWPVSGATYTLYKSEDPGRPFKEASHLISKAGKIVAYQFAEPLPAEGQTIYYQLKAVKGKQSLLSDTISVNLDKIPKAKARK